MKLWQKLHISIRENPTFICSIPLMLLLQHISLNGLYLNYPKPTAAKTILPLYCPKLTVKDWKQTGIRWKKMSFIPVNSLDSFLPELNKSKLSICLALCCPDIWYPDTHSDIQISLYCLDILISSYTADLLFLLCYLTP